MDITLIEDALIDALKALNIFRAVESVARGEKVRSLSYPSAFVYIESAQRLPSKPRPVFTLGFGVIIEARNLRSAGDAKTDAYTLIAAVYGAIEGKRFGREDIEPFEVTGIDLADYSETEISYEVKLGTRHYLPVPVME